MSEHSAPDYDDDVDPQAPAPQPVAISQAINGLIVAAVSAGWFTIDNTLINTVSSVIGGIIVIATTLKARASVIAIR